MASSDKLPMTTKSALSRLNCFIGTSGYTYPHWKNSFYPAGLAQKKWLEYYAGHFNSLELNVTFYRLPAEKTFSGWQARTPADFTFVIKGSRYITHIKRLRDCSQALSLFFSRAAELKSKLRCLLWQLPPSFSADPERLASFIEILSRKYGNYFHCFEFRHPSWFNDEIYDILRDHNTGLCVADSSRFPCADQITASFVYLRFHGSQDLYNSCYSDRQLKKWIDKISDWSDNIQNLFVFFNNDQKAYAVKNGLRFRQLLDERI